MATRTRKKSATKSNAAAVAASAEAASKERWASGLAANIASLKELRAGAQLWPSVSELAQLAATLRVASAEGDARTLAADAWELWQASRNHLGAVLEATIRAKESDLAFGLVAEWVPGKVPRVHFEKGKAEFESALKALVGEKSRRADRYVIFRKFLRDRVRTNTGITDEEQLAARAEKRFAELRRDGFTQEGFKRAEAWFVEWRTEQRRERAKKAAQERWKDDEADAAAGEKPGESAAK